LAIIGIVFSLAYPSSIEMYDHYRLLAAADSVRSGWVGARSHAVEEGQRYRFAVVPGKGNFRIAPDSAEYWDGSHPETNADYPPFVFEGTLGKGIRFTINGTGGEDDDTSDSSVEIGAVDSGQWTTQAFFDADGTSPEDVTITLAIPGSRPVVLSLRGLTCSTTIKMAPAEEGPR